MPPYKIDFEPVGRRGSCSGKESLLDCARSLGIGLISVCGGVGDCCRCKVQIVEGKASKPTILESKTFTSKELKSGWRLACQTHPESTIKLRVPPESMAAQQRLQMEGIQVYIHPKPSVHIYTVKMKEAADRAYKSDDEQLLAALNRQHHLSCRSIDVSVLRSLSKEMRSGEGQVQAAVRGREVIALTSRKNLPAGLAIDMGTTKLAGYLVDLNSGKTLAARGLGNPQVSYGEDIISRMTFSVKSPGGAKRMQELAVEACNRLIKELCHDAKTKPEEILDAVLAGNTAMHHLFLGLPVRQLLHSPFIPAISHALDIKARDTGLKISPGAYVHMLPNIAGFVGGDHVAMLLATEKEWRSGTVLALDIGTNTEVSLIHNGEITCVSCASGPAFEGGHIQDGMRAAEGAIERMRFIGGQLQYQTIGGTRPAGICGSGIIDAMAELYRAGVLDKGGRMIDGHSGIRINKGKKEFVILSEEERKSGPAIVITQQDIRELQMAKAAIRTGIQVLLDNRNLSEKDLDCVIIAGAFGSYIDIENAVISGMLPPLPLERFKQVGNAAGTGTKLALLSSTNRARARDIASRAKYIELSGAPHFKDIFLQAGYLGKYRIVKGKREDMM